MRIKLKVIDGGAKGPETRGTGAEIAIPVRRFFIGTADDCHLRCSGQSISPHHCMILLEDDRVVLRDDASQSGTFLNGQRIDTTACLFHGDRLRIGKLEFEVILRTDTRAVGSIPLPPPLPPGGAETSQATAPPIDPSLAQRQTVADTTDTISEIVVDMLMSEDDAERDRRRFDPAARQFRTEAEPSPNLEPPVGNQAIPIPKKLPPTSLPPPPPIRGENTVDAAEQALSQLLSPASKKKPGGTRTD